MSLKEFGKPVRALMFSPDGRALAAGTRPIDYPPGPVRLWQAPMLEEIDAAAKAGR
jgi:hypothetical protein